MGSDLRIANAARVSFDKESSLDDEGNLRDQDARLIRYLAEHEHTSPFNHSFLSFRVSAPLFVARQLVKHKFLVWNEVSRRYVDSEPTFYIPAVWRKRAENLKQGSSEEPVLMSMDTGKASTAAALESYKYLLKLGVCPEQARMVLPQNMMTSWYWSGSLGAFTDMVNLRLGPGAQKEASEIASMIKQHIEKLFPVASQHLFK